MYVEIGGIRYHASDIPFAAKNLASFINAKNSIE